MPKHMYKPDEVKEGVKKVNLKVFPKFPASFSFVYALLYYFLKIFHSHKSSYE